MAQPATYAITIKVNDVDVTSNVPFDSITFDDNRRQVSRWTMQIENPSGVTPARGHEVLVTRVSDSSVVFVGYVIELQTKKRDDGIVVIYDVECADRKIRLQKSVVPYLELSGADTSILSSLLSNTYPDLSSIFDFSTDVTGFANDLSLTTDEMSLFDALNELAEKADADYSFERTTAATTATSDFSGGGFGYDTTEDGDGLTQPGGGLPLDSTGVAAVGNPGNAAQGLDSTDGAGTLYVGIDLGSSRDITAINADIYFDAGGGTLTNPRIALYVMSGGAEGTEQITGGGASMYVSTTDNGTWETGGTDDDSFGWWAAAGGEVTGDYVWVRLLFDGNTGGSIDMRVDNVAITYGGNGAGKDELQWKETPTSTDFDIDVQSGDEFASDIETWEGDWDDYNSVTVVGGSTEEAIDWTYESDGDLDHINLETEVKDIAVYQNDGSDESPSWTLLDDGVFGTDELTGNGGSKDVLYDAKHHWLYLDSNAPNLSKSIRVTGNILKPLRVRVENVPAGQPTYATTITDTSITSLDDAVTVADAALEKRSSIKRVEFKTYEPGLKVGQLLGVDDSARSLSESLVIQRIQTKWLGGSGNAQFQIMAGDDEESGIDTLVANNDKRSRENALNAAPTTQTANFLTDDSGVVMTDDNGTELYEVT